MVDDATVVPSFYVGFSTRVLLSCAKGLSARANLPRPFLIRKEAMRA
jgi:hypothetical protein